MGHVESCISFAFACKVYSAYSEISQAPLWPWSSPLSPPSLVLPLQLCSPVCLSSLTSHCSFSRRPTCQPVTFIIYVVSDLTFFYFCSIPILWDTFFFLTIWLNPTWTWKVWFKLYPFHEDFGNLHCQPELLSVFLWHILGVYHCYQNVLCRQNLVYVFSLIKKNHIYWNPTPCRVLSWALGYRGESWFPLFKAVM